MKMVLTDEKRALSELILELTVSGDERFGEITEMAIEAAKASSLFSTGVYMEQIATALMAIVPANKPVLPGSLYAHLSALITSLARPCAMAVLRCHGFIHDPARAVG